MCGVERLHGREPVLPVGVDASEERRGSEDRVEPEHAAVDRDALLPAVDPEQARHAAPPQEADAVGHQLRVAGGLDDEIELAEPVERRLGT